MEQNSIGGNLWARQSAIGCAQGAGAGVCLPLCEKHGISTAQIRQKCNLKIINATLPFTSTRTTMLKTTDETSLQASGRSASTSTAAEPTASRSGQLSYTPAAVVLAMSPAGNNFSLGGNLWPSAAMPPAVHQTGMQLLRLWVDNGLSGPDSPTHVTASQADQWANITVTKNSGLATFKAFAADARRAGVQILLGGGGFGAPYMSADHVFDEARVDDAAAIWAAVVARMAAPDCMGYKPAFIELSNEPNGTYSSVEPRHLHCVALQLTHMGDCLGHWNTYIAPKVWSKLACAVRTALDMRGLQLVGISGPGVSLGSSRDYLLSLAASASLEKCVALISVHTWEDTATTKGPGEMAALLARYQALRGKFDPHHKKMWVATEYGSRTDSIGGVTFPVNRTVNKCYSKTPCYSTQAVECRLTADAEVLSPIYATRVAAFTLLHMNTQFDSVLYWWVEDYGESPGCPAAPPFASC